MQDRESVPRRLHEAKDGFEALVRQGVPQYAPLYLAGRGHRKIFDGKRADIFGRFVCAHVRRAEKERAFEATLRARLVNSLLPRNDGADLFSISLVWHRDHVDLVYVRGNFLERVLDGNRRDVNASLDDDLALAALQVIVFLPVDEAKEPDVASQEVTLRISLFTEGFLSSNVSLHNGRTSDNELSILPLAEEFSLAIGDLEIRPRHRGTDGVLVD